MIVDSSGNPAQRTVTVSKDKVPGDGNDGGDVRHIRLLISRRAATVLRRAVCRERGRRLAALLRRSDRRRSDAVDPGLTATFVVAVVAVVAAAVATVSVVSMPVVPVVPVRALLSVPASTAR